MVKKKKTANFQKKIWGRFFFFCLGVGGWWLVAGKRKKKQTPFNMETRAREREEGTGASN